MEGYGTDEGFNAWLAANGHQLPEGAPAPAILRLRGSVYVDGRYGDRFPGAPAAGVAQDRAWPRTGAYAYGSTIPNDLIPPAVVQASYAAALYEANNPGGLSVVATAAGAVKREKVGPIETEYFAGTGAVATDASPVLSVVEGLLVGLLVSDRPGVGIFTVGPR